MGDKKHVVPSFTPRKPKELAKNSQLPLTDTKNISDEVVSEEIRKVLYELKLPLNKKTKTVVKNFINENGGYEKFKNEIVKLKKLKESLAVLSPESKESIEKYKLKAPSYPVPPAPVLSSESTAIETPIKTPIKHRVAPQTPLKLEIGASINSSKALLSPLSPPLLHSPQGFATTVPSSPSIPSENRKIEHHPPLKPYRAPAPPPPPPNLLKIENNVDTKEIQLEHHNFASKTSPAPPPVVPRTKIPSHQSKTTDQLNLKNLKSLTENVVDERDFEITKLGEIFSTLPSFEYKHDSSIIDNYSISELKSKFDFDNLYEIKMEDLKVQIEEELENSGKTETVETSKILLRSELKTKQNLQNILATLKERLSVNFPINNFKEDTTNEIEIDETLSNTDSLISLNLSYDNKNVLNLNHNNEYDFLFPDDENQLEFETTDNIDNLNEKSGQNKAEHDSTTRDENSCKLCPNGKIECVFVDCGHMISCLNCGSNLKTCPRCKEPIVKALRFHR